jgi:hypothetical protein
MPFQTSLRAFRGQPDQGHKSANLGVRDWPVSKDGLGKLVSQNYTEVVSLSGAIALQARFTCAKQKMRWAELVD